MQFMQRNVVKALDMCPEGYTPGMFKLIKFSFLTKQKKI